MSWLLMLAMPMVAERWYGPATVAFELKTTGSPYDFQENDVTITFRDRGRTERRVAFFKEGKWYTIFLAKAPGLYTPTVFHNGRTVKTLPPVRISRSESLPFVRASGERFTLSNGKPYWPIGINVSWSSEQEKVWQILPMMGKSGMNWGRIWASSWDNKNPYWPTDRKLARREMAEETFENWDRVLRSTRESGIHFQWVLFNHGSFSTRVNPNWREHPWNAKNGGFLDKPQQFFLDEEAKRQTKNYLRYVMARYGHEPTIMAWELFNEVEWVDLAYDPGGWDKVGAWHDEMASFVKALDPYRHLVTSSSAMEHSIWKKLDYYQPHGYPPDVGLLVRAAVPPAGKPYFWGEVGGAGGSDQGAGGERRAIRDGIWSALFKGNAGAAQYWFWDRVTKYRLFDEWSHATAFIRKNQLEGQPAKYTGGLRSPLGGELRLVPGIGWGATKQTVFELPGAASAGELGKLSAFIQGTGHRDMLGEPVRFRFRAATAGVLKFKLGNVARQGAIAVIKLNGKPIFERTWPAAGEDRSAGVEETARFEAGDNELSIFNDGPDWFTLDWVQIEGQGQLASGFTASHPRGTLVRLDNPSGKPVLVTGAIQGSQASGIDLDTGKPVQASVRNGTLMAPPGHTVWRVK